MRQRKEWEIICTMAERDPLEFQTVAGIWALTGNGISRQELKRIVVGLAKQGHVHTVHAHSGLRVYRIPGAMIEFHLGGRGCLPREARE